MKDAQDLIPWKVTDISGSPFPGFWSFNPSLCFDGELWRVVLRCCTYAMPGGVTIRSKIAGPTGQQTKNAMVIIDPQTWKPIQIFKMHENDGLPRASTPHVGYEDMRIFRTDAGGLQGIAASLHLQRKARSVADTSLPHQPPEQVLLSFDAEYNIVSAQPLRGDWSGTAQKNWVPFDGATEPRFMYSLEKGSMFSTQGPVHGDEARVRPSTVERRVVSSAPVVDRPPSQESPTPQEPREDPAPAPPKKTDRRSLIRGGDVRIVSSRMKLDAQSSRPSVRPAHSSARPLTHRTDDSTRMMGGGRILLPKYEGLRGGTQLVRVGDDTWLGIGHLMKFVNAKKLYWHLFFTVNSRGKLMATSEPVKLAPEGIEFAAGLAIDGDRVVVSFGVDDMYSRLGETSLSAVMEKLIPVGA